MSDARATAHQERVERLLRQREARALRWSYGGRTLFLVLGSLVTLLNALGDLDFCGTLTLAAIGLAICGYGARVASRPNRELAQLLFIGRLGVAYDATLLIVLPIIWYLSVGGNSVNPAFLMRNEIALVIMVMLAINTVTLRPLYPWIITLTGTALLIAYALYAVPDPRVVLTQDNVEAVLGSAIKPGFYAWRIIATLLAGVFLTRLALWARTTIRDVVELEGTNLSMLERHTDALLEAKVGGMAKLVAGVVHELNTPVGALVSASSTAAGAAARVQHRISHAEHLDQLRNDAKLAELFRVSGECENTVAAANKRVATLLESLRSFSRLDTVKRERVDLAQALGRAVELIRPPLKGNVTVETDLPPSPPLEVDAAAFNQVYLTLLENAFEAMGGEGTLTLRSRTDDRTVYLEVQDTGHGLSEQQQAHLFDLAFAARKGRIGFGLGLPTAKRTIEAHGGSLQVQSALGAGARFTIGMPVPI